MDALTRITPKMLALYLFRLGYNIGNTLEGGVMNCSICGELIGKEASGWTEGHNAWPVNEGRCCGTCNASVVIRARLKIVKEETKEAGEAVGN